LAELPPLTVRVKAPLGTPVPVSGMIVGEVLLLLVMVSEPLRGPMAVGVKVTVTEQLWPGTSVVNCQGTVMA